MQPLLTEKKGGYTTFDRDSKPLSGVPPSASTLLKRSLVGLFALISLVSVIVFFAAASHHTDHPPSSALKTDDTDGAPLPIHADSGYSDDIPFFSVFGVGNYYEDVEIVLEHPDTGNLYSFGRFWDQTYDDEFGVNNELTVIVTDLNGNFLFAKRTGLPGTDYQSRAVIAPDGSIVVSLYSQSLHAENRGTIFVIKFNAADLSIVWAKQFEYSDPAWFSIWSDALLCTDRGELFLGFSKSHVDSGDISQRDYSKVVVKLDLVDGQVIWQKQVGDKLSSGSTGAIDLVDSLTEPGSKDVVGILRMTAMYMYRLNGETGEKMYVRKSFFTKTIYPISRIIISGQRWFVMGNHGDGAIYNSETGHVIAGFDMSAALSDEFMSCDPCTKMPDGPVLVDNILCPCYLTFNGGEGIPSRPVLIQLDASAHGQRPTVVNYVEFEYNGPLQDGVGSILARTTSVALLESSELTVDPPVLNVAIGGYGSAWHSKMKRDDGWVLKLMDVFNPATYEENGVNLHVTGCLENLKKTARGVDTLDVIENEVIVDDDANDFLALVDDPQLVITDIAQAFDDAWNDLASDDYSFRTCDCPASCGEMGVTGECSALGMIADPYKCSKDIECQSVILEDDCGTLNKCVSLCETHKAAMNGFADWIDCQGVCGAGSSTKKCWHPCADKQNPCVDDVCTSRRCKQNGDGFTCAGLGMAIDPFNCAAGDACVPVTCADCGGTRKCVQACKGMNRRKGMSVNCRAECGAVAGTFKCIASC